MTSKILCDTDFLISLYIFEESTYEIANQIYANHKINSEFWVTNITFYEVATVLSRKYPQPKAIEMLEVIRAKFHNLIRVTEQDEQETYNSTNPSPKKISHSLIVPAKS
jgi:predicted nucleic acid-binding protein